MTVTFTQRAVKALAAPRTGRLDVFDDKLPGFGLRLSDSGARTWFVMYRAAGRVRRFTIGSAAVLDLDAARLEAQKALLAAKTGSDPAAERQAMRRAQRAAERHEDDTFTALAALYLEKHAKAKKRSWRLDDLALKRDVLRAFGHKRACEVRAANVEVLMDRITEREAPAQAARTFALVRRIFNFALKSAQARERFGIVANPCAGVEPPAQGRSRDRVLSAEEIRQLWTTLDGEDAHTAAIFRLGLLTAQRPGEVLTMRREQLDLESAWWTIPVDDPRRARQERPRASRAPLGVGARGHP